MANDAEMTGLIGLKTKYIEDTKHGNHTATWGSYFDPKTKRWGFKCCRSTDKSNKKCSMIPNIE